jgi:hypothetical protein
MKKSILKFYIIQFFGLVSLFCVLLPWMSYGIGSKTGIDIGHVTLYSIIISGTLILLFSYVYFKWSKFEKTFLYLTFTSSLFQFIVYLFEVIRIMYQTTIAKNLPVEMFGVASLATAQIHVGYGLWLGLFASFFMSVLNLFVIRK